MPSARAFIERRGQSPADQVKLLVGAQLEPRAREGKRRPRQGWKTEDLAVKARTGFDRGDEEGDVVEFGYAHEIHLN